jgi:hypothetical protein
MRKLLLLIIFLFMSILVCTSFAQKNSNDKILASIPFPEDYVLNNSCLGRNFWIAIPQNETSNGDLKAIGVEIVVSSPYTTEVTLEIPEVGYTRTKRVEAFQPISFSSTNNDISYAMEVTESETITRKGIHLFADKPFSVHLINSREYSSEGLQAIPVERWGTEHYHCSYYDFFETNRPRGGGFIVVASEQATNVQIKLNGIGQLVGKTVMGHKIGETINVTLNAGETYMIRGDGKTKGEFDISGSRITSNKPVGVISFHMRTMVPSICPEDRDNLMEMLPSVNHWGKSFATVQYDRKTSGDRQGKGDLFRLMASEDLTAYYCDFYDIATYIKEGTRSFTLNRAAMFSEIDNILDINSSNKKKSVFGLAVWSTDKPAMLIQNAFSNRWDGDEKWSPSDIYVAPVEQYVRSCVFATPQTTGFQEHQMTLIAIGNPEDPNNTLLRTIMLNGKELWRTVPAILQNRIPNTNLWWVRVNLPTGSHYISSHTKFFAYLVGFDSYNSYAYPAAQNFDILLKSNEIDTVPPNFTKTMNCGNFSLEATEITIGKTGDNPKQTDQGLSEVIMIESLSNNYIFNLDNPSAFKPQLKIVKQKFSLTLIDQRKPAKAVFALMDRAGNIRLDSVQYDPPHIDLTPQSFDFGKIRLNNSFEKSVTITNNSLESYKINSISNKNPKYILSGLPVLPYVLASNDSLTIMVKYTPSLQSPTINDIDTLFVKSDCMNIEAGFTGKVIYPTVTVTPSYYLGKIKKGNKICLEELNQNGLKVKNNGSDVLTIQSFSEVEVPFLLTSPIDPLLPVTLNPGDSVYFKSFCFVPQDSGSFETQVTVHTDAIQGDSIITLKGEGKIEVVPSVSWDKQSGLMLSVSPNPATETINIVWSIETAVAVSLKIFDMQGNKVWSDDNSSRSLNGKQVVPAKDFVPGIYSVVLSNGNSSLSQMIVILK